jgi:hypothetical protein
MSLLQKNLKIHSANLCKFPPPADTHFKLKFICKFSNPSCHCPFIFYENKKNVNLGALKSLHGGEAKKKTILFSAVPPRTPISHPALAARNTYYNAGFFFSLVQLQNITTFRIIFFLSKVKKEAVYILPK